MSAEIAARAMRFKEHNEKMEAEVGNIKRLLDDWQQRADDDDLLDSAREQLKVTALTRNIAIETSYRDRKSMEFELATWATAVKDRGESHMEEVLEMAKESNQAVAEAVGDPTFGEEAIPEDWGTPSPALLTAIREAVGSLQKYGSRVLGLARAVQTKELSLEEFSQRLQREMEGVQSLLLEPIDGEFKAARIVDSNTGKEIGPGGMPNKPPSVLQKELDASLQAQRTQQKLIEDLEVRLMDAQETVDRMDRVADDAQAQLQATEDELKALRSQRLKVQFSQGSMTVPWHRIHGEQAEVQTEPIEEQGSFQLKRTAGATGSKRSLRSMRASSPGIGAAPLGTSGVWGEVEEGTLYETIARLMGAFMRRAKTAGCQKTYIRSAFYLYRLAARRRWREDAEKIRALEATIEGMEKTVAKKVREAETTMATAAADMEIVQGTVKQLLLKMRKNDDERGKLVDENVTLAARVQELEEAVASHLLNEMSTAGSRPTSARPGRSSNLGATTSNLNLNSTLSGDQKDRLSIPSRCIDAVASAVGTMRLMLARLEPFAGDAPTNERFASAAVSRSMPDLENHLVTLNVLMGRVNHPNIAIPTKQVETMLSRVQDIVRGRAPTAVSNDSLGARPQSASTRSAPTPAVSEDGRATSAAESLPAIMVGTSEEGSHVATSEAQGRSHSTISKATEATSDVVSDGAESDIPDTPRGFDDDDRRRVAEQMRAAAAALVTGKSSSVSDGLGRGVQMSFAAATSGDLGEYGAAEIQEAMLAATGRGALFVEESVGGAIKKVKDSSVQCNLVSSFAMSDSPRRNRNTANVSRQFSRRSPPRRHNIDRMPAKVRPLPGTFEKVPDKPRIQRIPPPSVHIVEHLLTMFERDRDRRLRLDERQAAVASELYEEYMYHFVEMVPTALDPDGDPSASDGGHFPMPPKPPLEAASRNVTIEERSGVIAAGMPEEGTNAPRRVVTERPPPMSEVLRKHRPSSATTAKLVKSREEPALAGTAFTSRGVTDQPKEPKRPKSSRTRPHAFRVPLAADV